MTHRLILLLLVLWAMQSTYGRNDYDIYLMIGQSNMAGRAPMLAADSLSAIDGVWLLNADGKPEPAVAPLNRHSTIRKDLGLQGLGPAASFGAQMHRLTGRKVLLVHNARGGSSIRSWQPASADGYLDSAIVRTRQAMRYGRLRGICWHQGETDVQGRGASFETGDDNAHTAAGSGYIPMFAAMTTALRQALGDVPIVVGEIGQWEWTDGRKIRSFNDTILPRIANDVANVSIASSDGLKRRWNDKPRDPHFGREAVVTLGRRYAEAMMRLLDQPRVRIAQFKGGRHAAISFTYDDGMGEHFSLVAPELEKRGFRGTFWVIGNKVGAREDYDNRITWDECRQLAERGHEVSSHSWSHPHLTRLSADSLLVEILKNDSAIEQATGRRPVTFCYPYNEHNDLVLRLASNGRVGTRLHQVGHGEQNSKVTPERLSRWLHDVVEQHEWGVTMTHGITHGYDMWYHPEWLWGLYDEVKAMGDTVWVATFARVSAYRAEREAVRMRVHDRYRTKIIVHTRLHLDERLFDQPLTLEVLGDWHGKQVTARQGRTTLPVDNRGDRLLIDFMPAGRRVKIDW